MNEEGFVTRREADWNRFETLCSEAESRPSRLTAADMKEFLRLYRLASTDLSTIRSKSTNPALTDSLNDLVGRGYAVLYRAPRKPLLTAIVDAMATAAQTVRRRRVFVFVSIAMFLVASFGSFLLLTWVPDLQAVFIPAAAKENFDAWKSGDLPDRDLNQSAAAWGMYASNNPVVAIISGAVGAGTFGIVSTYLILKNGVMVGALAHYVTPAGKLGYLLSSICPHGVTELSGLFMSGAAGLLLGYALINPGRRSRGEALREVGSDAITLLGTSVVLMFIAAPIEGFFSFNSTVPMWAKLGFAGCSLIAWLSFWTYFGRTEDEIAKAKKSKA